MSARARFLLVGEAPAPDGTKRHLHLALACRATGKLPAPGMPGWLRANRRPLFDFVRATRHVNLLGRWPGSSGRGSKFPLAEARAAAHALEVIGYDLVLFAGRRVTAAFGVHAHHAGVDYFQPFGELGFRAVMVPHPSGVNRWWRSRANRTRALRFLGHLVA